jgi:hypothetical protein
MMGRLLIWMIAAAIALATPACGRRADTKKPDKVAETKIDPCTLLLKQEVEASQSSRITDTKSSENTGGDFRVSQCFYTAAEFNKSVNLAIAQANPTNPHSRTPKQFWQETFGRSAEKNEKGEKESREEKERRTPPKKIEGVGDDAYWASNRFGGVLYVLKSDAFISISVGGTDSEQAKIDKCKALAQKAIGRM